MNDILDEIEKLCLHSDEDDADELGDALDAICERIQRWKAERERRQ